jgi:glycosyltransferase involved in cell wall biosynthesis
MMPRFLRAADAVIAVSQHTKDDAIRTYGIEEEKISVIYEGVSDRFRRASPDAITAVRRKYGLPGGFILSVATIEPRKNLTSLLEAYHALRSEFAENRLVLVGKKGWLYADFFRRIRELGLEDQVIFPGYVPDEDLPAMYSAADLFVFPSLYEGFGLPVLEALACGAPVVASNASSLPEVAGDAALLVDPNDGEALVHEMRAVLSNAELSHDMQTRGPKQAAKFSWHKAARETLDVYSSVLSD